MRRQTESACADRVALVTGAAGDGMGRSIALTLVREGAKVVVNYRTSREAAESIVAHVRDRGGEAVALQADVFDADRCRSLVDAALDAFGRVDILVIGPGGGWHMGPAAEVDPAEAVEDVRREVAPVYHLLPLVLPGMVERRWGRVVGLGLEPLSPYRVPAHGYCIGKAARTRALLAVRDEVWPRGVTVNVVGPGPAPAVATLDEAVDQCDHGPAWAARRTVSPQDVAEGVAFLCSEAGRFISGAVLSCRHNEPS